MTADEESPPSIHVHFSLCLCRTILEIDSWIFKDALAEAPFYCPFQTGRFFMCQQTNPKMCVGFCTMYNEYIRTMCICIHSCFFFLFLACPKLSEYYSNVQKNAFSLTPPHTALHVMNEHCSSIAA